MPLLILSLLGVAVQTINGTRICRCLLLATLLDLPARAIVYNTKQFNGKYGCIYCENEGASPVGNPLVRYWLPQQNATLRTHQSMMDNARTAIKERQAVSYHC